MCTTWDIFRFCSIHMKRFKTMRCVYSLLLLHNRHIAGIYIATEGRRCNIKRVLGGAGDYTTTFL